jgi:hypothetical protein
MITFLSGFHCGLCIYNIVCHGYTPVAIVTSLRGSHLVTMITCLHACWVSNTTVSKTGRTAHEYGVSQSCYGTLYDNEKLHKM